MCILSGPAIRQAMAAGEIKIDPPPRTFNPGSVNLTLGAGMLVYNLWGSPYCRGPARSDAHPDGYVRHLSTRRKNPTMPLVIPTTGYVLKPGVLYLAATVEMTETLGYVPQLEGRSSVGRLGLFIHVTAGYGENGFRGRWTCELLATHPVEVFPGDEFCQLKFTTIHGEQQRYSGRYQGDEGPVASRLHLEGGGHA